MRWKKTTLKVDGHLTKKGCDTDMNRFHDFLYNFLFEEKVDLVSDSEELINEINQFRSSYRRMLMLDGERYYEGIHDILSKKRTAIGENGELITIDNLPNARIVDNRYAEMVDQKKNYLLGQPLVFKSDNKEYNKLLSDTFSMGFMRMIKNVLLTSINEGISYVYVGYNEKSELSFTPMKGYEVVPIWKDAEHTILEKAIRFYPVVQQFKSTQKTIEKIELYNEDGVYRMIYDSGKLYVDEPRYVPYIQYTRPDGSVEGYNWNKLPVIPFKYNSKEIPLIKKTKSIQDAINRIMSNFEDNMEEDVRNTILVLINYDGENLGEFRRNLATYGAVKIRNDSSMGGGDLKTLQVEVNADNYKSILDILNQKLIENARGYDVKNANLGGNPNQMNILSMYSDIDLDANDIETEFQAAFEDLLWFVDMHYKNIHAGDYESVPVTVIFNRDMMVNESEIIDNVNKSQDLSLETRLANHPWVDDPQEEMERKKKEQEEELARSDPYTDIFPTSVPPGREDIDGNDE